MPKTAHQIKVKVFSYEKFNEDDNLILGSFLKLFPFNLEDEKIGLNKTNAIGLNDKKITIFEVTLSKEKHCNRFLENLSNKIDSNEKNNIISQLESRLDDNLDFFLRFDKNEYINNGKLVLTDSGNCFHIEISVAAFPKKREIVLEIVKGIFSK